MALCKEKILCGRMQQICWKSGICKKEKILVQWESEGNNDENVDDIAYSNDEVGRDRAPSDALGGFLQHGRYTSAWPRVRVESEQRLAAFVTRNVDISQLVSERMTQLSLDNSNGTSVLIYVSLLRTMRSTLRSLLTNIE